MKPYSLPESPQAEITRNPGRCEKFQECREEGEEMKEMENRFANAEAYAAHYCDARDFSESAIRNVVWSAVRSGFFEGDMHATADSRRRIDTLERERDELRAERDRLREALVFYRDERNWLRSPSLPCSAIVADTGSRARQALASEPSSEPPPSWL